MQGSQIRWGPLRVRNFRWFFAGYSTSLFGTGMAPVAVAFAVIGSGGSASDLGFVLTGQVAASVLCLLAGGVVADRIGHRVVMLGSDVVRTISQGAFAALVLLGHPPIGYLVGLSALQGGASGFFSPALMALTPQLLAKEDLHDANVLIGLAENFGRIAGPAVAGALVAITSPGVVVASDAATYAVSVMSLAILHLGDLDLRPSQGLLADLRDGWVAWRSRAWLWITSVKFAFANMLVLGPFLVLGPVEAKHRLGGAGAWGLILTAVGVGAFVGGLAIKGRRPARPMVFVTIVQAAWALPIAALAGLLPAPAIAAAALLAGVGSATFNVVWNSTLQSSVPAEMLARVTSYDYLASFALAPIGLAIAGPAAATIGASAVLWFAVAWQVLSTIVVLGVPSIRSFPDPRLAQASAEERGS